MQEVMNGEGIASRKLKYVMPIDIVIVDDFDDDTIDVDKIFNIAKSQDEY